MKRTIIFRDGVFYDEQWNAVTPDLDELLDIAAAVFKYTEIGISDATKQPFSRQG